MQVGKRLIERFKCDWDLLWTDTICNWGRYVLDTAVIVVARRSINYWNRWYVLDTVTNDITYRSLSYWNGLLDIGTEAIITMISLKK